MNNMSLSETIRTLGSFYSVSPYLCSMLGSTDALFFEYLLSQRDYFYSDGRTSDGWFYCSVNRVSDNTDLSRFQQEGIVDRLVKKGLIEYKLSTSNKVKRRFFKINDADVVNAMLDYFYTKKDEVADEFSIDENSRTRTIETCIETLETIVRTQETIVRTQETIVPHASYTLSPSQETRVPYASDPRYNNNIYNNRFNNNRNNIKDKDNNLLSPNGFLSPGGDDTMVDALAMVQSFLGRADSSDDPTASF